MAFDTRETRAVPFAKMFRMLRDQTKGLSVFDPFLRANRAKAKDEAIEAVKRYRVLREAGKKLHNKIMHVIPRPIVVSTAKELGLWKGGGICTDEGDSGILLDRMIYDKKWDGKKTLEHFANEHTALTLPEDEARYFNAMKTARFSLFRIESTVPSRHLVLSEIPLVHGVEIGNGHLEVMDLNLSATATPFCLLGLRLLDAGDFFITSGVSFPFADQDEGAICKYLGERELGSRKKRFEVVQNYSIYFYKLHRRFGIPVEHV